MAVGATSASSASAAARTSASHRPETGPNAVSRRVCSMTVSPSHVAASAGRFKGINEEVTACVVCRSQQSCVRPADDNPDQAGRARTGRTAEYRGDRGVQFVRASGMSRGIPGVVRNV